MPPKSNKEDVSNHNSKLGPPTSKYGGNSKKHKGKSTFNMSIRVSRKINDLNSLIAEVSAIEKKCSPDAAGSDNQDDFKALADYMLLALGQVKNKIKERHLKKIQGGTNADVIRSGMDIQKDIEKLDMEFIALKDEYKQQNILKKLYAPEELARKFQDLQVIRAQVEDCKHLMQNENISAKQVAERCDFAAQMQQTDVAPPGNMNEWREPTAEESHTISRWAQRDAEQDVAILEVGVVVDQLKQFAEDMGEKAHKQSEMAIDLMKQADEAHEDLFELNNKVKEFIGKSTGGTFFTIRLVLLLTCLIELAWLVSLTITKVKLTMKLSS